MVNNYEGLSNTTYVGFEDLYRPIADFNYTDEVFAFTGASSSSSVPDAPETMELLGLGLVAVGLLRRRFSK